VKHECYYNARTRETYLLESQKRSVRSRLDDKCVERGAAEASLAATLQVSLPRPSVGSEWSTTSQSCLNKQTAIIPAIT